MSRFFRVGALAQGMAALAALAGAAQGADWPHWRGPASTGISTETQWQAEWPPEGPPVLWRAEVGVGFSSLAVCEGRVYTLGNRRGTDYVFCLDAATGRERWTHSYPCRQGGHKGPRATPTVHEGRVYTLSRESDLFCFKAHSGQVVWHKNVAKAVGAGTPRWGFASSPLIEGDLVIVNVGTAGTALDKATGEVVWTTGREAAGYSTACAFTRDGHRRLALFAAKALVVLDAPSGKPVWRHPWLTRYDVNAVTPIVWDGQVFVSSDYGVGAALLRIGADEPVLWHTREMKNHFNNCVLWQGHLYGFDMNTLKCLSARDGAVRWEKAGFGKGSLMIAGGKLLILGDSGELAVAEATHEDYRELARARVITGLCWTVPVLAGGRIYCRSHPGHLVCLDVRGEGGAP